MARYVLLNLEKRNHPTIIDYQEEVIFDDGRDNEKTFYVCGVCFRTLETRNQRHLDKCNLFFPINARNCYRDINKKINIFEIIKEEGYTRKLMKYIERMAYFSKLDQGIDLKITQQGLVGRGFSCYALFDYKNIASYCLVQEYKERGQIIHPIIRDLYTFPPFRRKKYASLLLRAIAKQYGMPLEYFLFSDPISEKLKLVLKKMGLKQVITIQGENLRSIQFLYL